MSVSSYTDWQVSCDQGGCPAEAWSSQIGLMDGTAASVRRILRQRGWLVNVPNPIPGGSPPRLDFCPNHKGLELCRRGRAAIEHAEAERTATTSTNSGEST